MYDFEWFLNQDPYGLVRTEKDAALTAALKELTEWHCERCIPYRRMGRYRHLDPVFAHHLRVSC